MAPIGVDSERMDNRKRVGLIVDELKLASRRSLYSELDLLRLQKLRRRKSQGEDAEMCISDANALEVKSWSQTLSMAASVLPFMTEAQHGVVLEVASIYLHAFLVGPNTPSELYLLQNWKKNMKRGDPNQRMLNVDDYVLHLPLEERLNVSLPADPIGEENFLSDPELDVAFEDFFDELSKLLSERPVHTQSVNILHLLSMMIHPRPILSQKNNRHEAWAKALRLAQHTSALQFNIGYPHRQRAVALVEKYLVLPKLSETSGLPVSPLLFGAIPHLQASLRSFVATNWQHAHSALCSHASVSVQIQDASYITREWDFLLHFMVDDKSDYTCSDRCHCPPRTSGSGKAIAKGNDFAYCPHSARGELLHVLFVRASHSQKASNASFLRHAAVSLSDAIEWQTDCWTNNDDSDDESEEKLRSPCLLASLLYTAQSLFVTRFLSKKLQERDDDPFDTLVRCSIQLLHHSDEGIRNEALTLLVHAIKYGRSTKSYMKSMVKSIEDLLNAKRDDSSLLEPLTSAASSRSRAFALQTFEILLNTVEKSAQGNEAIFRVIGSLSFNVPAAAWTNISRLTALLDSEYATNCKQHVVFAIMSSRLARFFTTSEDVHTADVAKFVKSACAADGNAWDLYQIFRHALVTGNFNAANKSVHGLLERPVSDATYLWLLTLSKLSGAEATLSNKVALGIADASVSIHSALSYMESLGTLSKSWRNGGAFHVRFLLLRLDFLDLITVVRQLTREMRLTGKPPAKRTRSLLHLRNAARGFVALAGRYRELLQQHGMCFQYNDSRTSLRILQALCHFVFNAINAVFSDVLAGPRVIKGKSVTTNNECMKLLGESRHPMALLIRRLDELVVQPMDGGLDSRIRAAAMLELIDGLLMIPLPFPRDFLTPQPSATPEWKIHASPERTFTTEDDSLLTIETAPSLAFSFCCSGQIPPELLAKSKTPCWTVLVWFRMVFVSALVDEDEDNENIDDAERERKEDALIAKMPDVSTYSPASSILSSEGRFYMFIECPPLKEEGMYKLELKLGCRDVSGNEWTIPDRRTNPVYAPVHCVRSRALAP